MSYKIDFELAAPLEVEAALGRRLEEIRLSRNINQTDLAAEAGVSRRTITRLENGEGVSLDTLIRVMRALGLAGRLAALLPDPGVRPIERVRLKGKERKHARRKSTRAPLDWTWAEDPKDP